MSHVKQALALGYSVLALDPNDAAHNCWSSSTRGRNVNDQPDVRSCVTGAGGRRGAARGEGEVHVQAAHRVCWRALTGPRPGPFLPPPGPQPRASQPTVPPPLPPRPPQVIETVSEFLKEHGLAGKPLYLWGASSGGTLALKLPATLAALRAAAEAEGKEYRHRLEVAGIISGAPRRAGLWRAALGCAVPRCAVL